MIVCVYCYNIIWKTWLMYFIYLIELFWMSCMVLPFVAILQMKIRWKLDSLELWRLFLKLWVCTKRTQKFLIGLQTLYAKSAKMVLISVIDDWASISISMCLLEMHGHLFLGLWFKVFKRILFFWSWIVLSANMTVFFPKTK